MDNTDRRMFKFEREIDLEDTGKKKQKKTKEKKKEMIFIKCGSEFGTMQKK